jgi:predicted Zn-dependent protease with MMP-like domain
MRNEDKAWADRIAPSLADFEAIAARAYGSIPATFREMAGDVTLAVAEFPDDDVVEELEAESPFDILGLFQGVGLAHASAVPETGVMPNRIWLYRRPILDYWAEHEETLGDIVANVLIHEIGHHFGLSDDDMDAIEEAAG